MRALVISGGGSKGAFAGGVAEYLINECKYHYDILVGTSTGSLLVPLLAIEEIEKLKSVYTNVCQKDIFSINPFTISKKNGETTVGINHFNIVLQFLLGRKTFGNSSNLRNLIPKIFCREDYEKVKALGKKVVVTVANLSTDNIEYKYLRDVTYDDFCDWMWISTNFVPFMSLAIKNGYEYADGGFGDFVPIQEAVNIGAKEIDVIVLNPRIPQIKKIHSTNAFNLLMSSFDFMLHQIGKDDMIIGMLESRYSNVKVNFYHTPRKLTEISFVFEPAIMKSWWKEGYDFADQKLNGKKS